MSGLTATTGVQPAPTLLSSGELVLLKNNIKTLADSSKRLAREILDNGRPLYASSGTCGSRITEVHHYYHGGGYYPLYQPIYVGGGRGRRDNDDTAARVVVGVAAAVVGGVATYALGRAINELQHSCEEASDARHLRRELDSCQQRVPENDRNVVKEASTLARLKERVHKRMKSSSLMDLIFRAILVAGAALALAGAFVCPPLMLVGIAVGVVAGAAMLFKCGLNTPDRHNIRDACEMQRLARNLEAKV